jgi:hypothetical protein
MNTALGDEQTSGERPGMNIPRFGEPPNIASVWKDDKD